MSVKTIKYSIGCDMSKDKFDACAIEINDSFQGKIKATNSFENSAKGFKTFQSWYQRFLKKEGMLLTFTLEATGVYYENLAWFLHLKRQTVHIVLPYKAKHYHKSLHFYF